MPLGSGRVIADEGPDRAALERRMRELRVMEVAEFERHVAQLRATRAWTSDATLLELVAHVRVVDERKGEFADLSLADDFFAQAAAQEVWWGFAEAAALGDDPDDRIVDQVELEAVVAAANDGAAVARSLGEDHLEAAQVHAGNADRLAQAMGRIQRLAPNSSTAPSSYRTVGPVRRPPAVGMPS